MALNEMVAIVTGGTRGLGAAIASELAQHGATVVCASRSGQPADSPNSSPPRIQIERVDVTDADDVSALVQRVLDSWGRLDVMIANAALNHDGKVTDLSLADWNEVLATNLSGTLHCIRAAARPMRAQGAGRIIAISSAMARNPAIGTAAYAASKAGIEALTRVSALDLARNNITVNAIAPGILDDGLGRHLLANEPLWSTYRKHIAMGRAGQVDEVARVARWLADPETTYINGAVFDVHGGLSPWV